MAKAKKTTTTTEPGAAQQPKKAAKGKKVPPPATPPMVDTALAASVAARQLAAGLAPPLASAGPGKESASFKQLKQSLANPAAGGLDSVLDKTAAPGSRRADLPFAGPRGPGGPGAAGRNQTFGADVNRAGVPRRTSGG